MIKCGYSKVARAPSTANAVPLPPGGRHGRGHVPAAHHEYAVPDGSLGEGAPRSGGGVLMQVKTPSVMLTHDTSLPEGGKDARFCLPPARDRSCRRCASGTSNALRSLLPRSGWRSFFNLSLRQSRNITCRNAANIMPPQAVHHLPASRAYIAQKRPPKRSFFTSTRTGWRRSACRVA